MYACGRGVDESTEIENEVPGPARRSNARERVKEWE